MPGLDPGIHAPPLGTPLGTIGALPYRVDPRVKPGDDEERDQPSEIAKKDKYIP